jgi:lipoprotein-releasing system ATP-binding protein
MSNVSVDQNQDFAVEVQNLKKVYPVGDAHLTVLDKLNLKVKRGSIAAVIGRSGSGKSTLLHLIGGIDSPTDGIIIVRNRHIENATEEELSRFRNKYIGFIFQFHNLLSEFTVIENVMMPYLIGQFQRARAYKKGLELLRLFEIEDKKGSKPNKLSGGESQRVAIARALINNPEVVLADEPTGNLDLHTAEKINEFLFQIVRKYGHTLLIVTHNPSVVENADVTYELKLGSLNRLLAKSD